MTRDLNVIKFKDTEYDLRDPAQIETAVNAAFEHYVVGTQTEHSRSGVQSALHRDQLMEIAKKGLREIDNYPAGYYKNQTHAVTSIKIGFLQGLGSLTQDYRDSLLNDYSLDEPIRKSSFGGIDHAFGHTLAQREDTKDGKVVISPHVAPEHHRIAEEVIVWADRMDDITLDFSKTMQADMITLQAACYDSDLGGTNRKKYLQATASTKEGTPAGTSSHGVTGGLKTSAHTFGH